MRVVLQRVSRASVSVGGVETGSIGRGLLLLVGFAPDDTAAEVAWMSDKVLGLRIFPDDQGKMNRSLGELAGGEDPNGPNGAGLLVVSQFTLYGDARKGRRPSFVGAAPPEVAVPLYESFVARLAEASPGPVETGEFGAAMEVSLVNDGPVTLVLEREAGTP